MAGFISTELTKQTLSKELYSSKIILNKNEVSLDFLESKDMGNSFKLIYIIRINTKGRKLDPGKVMSMTTLDLESLKNGIVSNFSVYDKKYLMLKAFDDKRAIFEFNYEKWLKEATNGMVGKTYFSKFDREFKFKILPPKEIKKDLLSIKFEKFITRKFLDSLEKKTKEQKEFFKYLIPPKEQKKIKTSFRNMFDWYYDSQWNKMVAKLKSIYIIALMYATGSAIKKLSQKNITKSQKELFSTKVSNNLISFDKKKWEDFTRKRFF